MTVYLFGQAMNPIIRSDGSPKFAMAATLAGAVANITLDPVAIFILGWGIKGTAIATVAGQILTAALSLGYFFHMRSVRLCRKSFRLGGVIGQFLPWDLPAFSASFPWCWPWQSSTI